jgi:hypothetical protein
VGFKMLLSWLISLLSQVEIPALRFQIFFWCLMSHELMCIVENHEDLCKNHELEVAAKFYDGRQ